MGLSYGPSPNDARVLKDERITKKDAIFEHAIQVFAEKGFDRATIDDIAEHAGIAKGTFYYHFKSKKDLFDFLLQESGQLLLAGLQREIELDEPVLQRLNRIIDLHLSFFDNYREFCIMLFNEMRRPSERWQGQMKRMRRSYLVPLVALIREGQAAGVLRTVDPNIAAQIMFGAISSVAMAQVFMGEPANTKKVSQAIKRILLDGLMNHEMVNPPD